MLLNVINLQMKGLLELDNLQGREGSVSRHDISGASWLIFT